MISFLLEHWKESTVMDFKSTGGFLGLVPFTLFEPLTFILTGTAEATAGTAAAGTAGTAGTGTAAWASLKTLLFKNILRIDKTINNWKASIFFIFILEKKKLQGL
jgi:hypothetical protein